MGGLSPSRLGLQMGGPSFFRWAACLPVDGGLQMAALSSCKRGASSHLIPGLAGDGRWWSLGAFLSTAPHLVQARQSSQGWHCLRPPRQGHPPIQQCWKP